MKNLTPLFPFGYGLSYATFDYLKLDIHYVDLAAGTITVGFEITNTSQVDGREIAQVYISDKHSSLPRPVKELKGFVKANLRAGQTESYTVKLDKEAWGYYDDRKKSWVAEKGKYEVLVAASSVNVKLRGEVELKETLFWTGL